MSGSEPAGQTVVQNTKDPWSGQEPYLRSGFQRADEAYQTPKEFFPNATTVPFSPQTETALQAQEERATAGSPLLEAGQGELQKVLGGEYLNQQNPAFQGMADATRRAIRPGIDSQFAGAGRYGGAGHEEMMARTMADAMAPLAYRDYEAERGNMQKAAYAAPEMAQADYADIGQLGQVGAAREGLARDELAEDIDRFNFEQYEPEQRLARYMASIGGGSYGSSGTTTQPYYTNRTGEILGAAQSGASTLASLASLFRS